MRARNILVTVNTKIQQNKPLRLFLKTDILQVLAEAFCHKNTIQQNQRLITIKKTHILAGSCWSISFINIKYKKITL
jgi:hypothetical protein